METGVREARLDEVPTVDAGRGRVSGRVLFGVALMHLGCLLAPFFVTWSAIVVAAILYWLTGGLGITLGFHRLLAHRSFRVPTWFESIVLVLGCMAWQGGPVRWVATHRLHHAQADVPADPHSPRDGFFWSHCGWFLREQPPEALALARDLERDPQVAWFDRYYWLPQVLLAPLLVAGGELAAAQGISATGASWLVWGIFVRTTLAYHATWFVNSATHVWGTRRFETDDDSRNLWWVALLTFGEGWHNNHHAYMRAAAHGLGRLELDLTYATICGLEWLGVAKGVVRRPRTT